MPKKRYGETSLHQLPTENLCAFPEVLERQIMVYNKHVPEDEIHGFIQTTLDSYQFPDIRYSLLSISGTGVPPLTPAVSTRKSEMGILVTHNSEVFQSIFVLFRAVNLGQITVIGEHKCSNYKAETSVSSDCCEDTPTTTFDTINCSRQDILEGKLIYLRFTDGSNVDFWPAEEWRQMVKGRRQRHHSKESIARYELYNAFYFLCDKVIFPAMKKFVEDY